MFLQIHLVYRREGRFHEGQHSIYFEDGQRINLLRFGKPTYREQLPSFKDPRKWKVGTKVEFEKMKDKQMLSAFGNLIIPAGVNVARQRDLEEKIRFQVTRKKDNKIDVQFIQNVYLEKGGYGSLIEVLGKMRSKGSSQILVQKFRFDLDKPEAMAIYTDLVKNGVFPGLLEHKLQDYIASRDNQELLQFVKHEKQELEKYGISRLSTEWVRPSFKKKKYIAGFQLLGVPGYSGERTTSEAPLKQINENGVWERYLISTHALKERPRARFKSSSSVNSIEYFEYLDGDQELKSDFHGIRGEWAFSFTKVFGDNIQKTINKLNRYLPCDIGEFKGEGKERTLELELVLEPEDIENLRREADISLAEKIWQDEKEVKELPRKHAVKLIEDLSSSEDQAEAISHIREFLVAHPTFGMGFLGLLAGKNKLDRLVSSSRIYEKPFKLVDEFFLTYSDFSTPEKTYHENLDVEHKKFLNKFHKQGLYILKKIDLAFKEIKNDSFLDIPNAMAKVYDEAWSKEELQARLWLIRKQVQQFMDRLLEESDDKDSFIKGIRAKNRGLKNKIVFYRSQLESESKNKRGKNFYIRKYLKYRKISGKEKTFVFECQDSLPAYEYKVREEEFDQIDELLKEFRDKIESLP